MRHCQIFINALIYLFAPLLFCVCFFYCALFIVLMRRCFFPDLLSYSFIRSLFIFAYNFRALDNMFALLVLYRYFMDFFLRFSQNFRVISAFILCFEFLTDFSVVFAVFVAKNGIFMCF